MRILLMFIIILNLLYVGWEMLSPVKSRVDVAPMPSGLKTLELLNEDKITLLKSEQKNTAVNSSTESDVETLNNDALSQSSKICYTLGPFKDENIMQQLRESIAEYVTDISVRKRKELVKHRYWVYLPALENKKQARLVGKQLRENRLNDFYIVLSGEEKNSISLGHFREPSHANRRVKKVVELGFEAKIKVIYREYDIFWLDYQVAVASEGASFSADEYVSDGISQLKRDCAL